MVLLNRIDDFSLMFMKAKIIPNKKIKNTIKNFRYSVINIPTKKMNNDNFKNPVLSPEIKAINKTNKLNKNIKK